MGWQSDLGSSPFCSTETETFQAKVVLPYCPSVNPGAAAAESAVTARLAAAAGAATPRDTAVAAGAAEGAASPRRPARPGGSRPRTASPAEAGGRGNGSNAAANSFVNSGETPELLTARALGREGGGLVIWGLLRVGGGLLSVWLSGLLENCWKRFGMPSGNSGWCFLWDGCGCFKQQMKLYPLSPAVSKYGSSR